MRESSLAEKAVAVFLAVVIGLLVNLNREVGVTNAKLDAHLFNHPEGALERRIDRHEDQMHFRAQEE